MLQVPAFEMPGLAQMLKSIKSNGALPPTVHVDLLPTYYPRLLELTIRVMKRPDSVLPTLRLLELATTVTSLGQRFAQPEDMGGLYDDIAAKRAADVVGFLVGTAGLDSGFRVRARSLLLGEPLT
ncbi:hypothetical protein [Streptomyces ipomoeae]|uniref:hypothetical protein n=1 Tax=Streptomyces ipomoeae TaxID=103232 RepID=UPI0011462C54|nr:hypothetical protein [Streptomyces ipomoeae]MDX2936998.1 hypothetical protein [Streptomyces ipomoeae]TQE20110.1 hypothetical protein SipoB123_29410 [Streptomyces ipomoeae]